MVSQAEIDRVGAGPNRFAPGVIVIVVVHVACPATSIAAAEWTGRYHIFAIGVVIPDVIGEVMSQGDPSAGSPVDTDYCWRRIAHGRSTPHSTGSVHVAAQEVGFAAMVVAHRRDGDVQGLRTGSERNEYSLVVNENSTAAGYCWGWASNSHRRGARTACSGGGGGFGTVKIQKLGRQP